MQFHLTIAAAALLATAAIAQNTLFAPAGYATVPGNSNNSYPWHRATTPIRYQQLYSALNFTQQGVTYPVLLSRLRFRVYTAAATWTGGTWSNTVLNMSTSPLGYLAASMTFAQNNGPNLATVYSGPITVMPGTGAGPTVPGPIYIDINFTTPFLYDPAGGDLCFEVLQDGVGWTGASTFCDAVSSTTGAGGPALGTRVYNITSHTATTGTVGTNFTLVTEFTYVPASGYAYSSAYGAGCYDRARSSFYQLFPASTFNLSNSSIQMIPSPGGYVAVPSGTQWWTPVGANLALIDNAVSAAVPLGFTFNYPGGSTTNLYVSSNGYVWLQSSIDNGCCAGLPSALLAMGARICPLWNDLNPAAGGTVVADIDAPNQVAYVTFTNVPETGTSNLNTFQVAVYASGIMEMRWRNCSVTSHATVTGWSPGGGARDPGSVNLQASLPILTNTDLSALQLAASARPVTGTSINLVTSNIPASTSVGASIFSNTQHNPGIDLASIGMPGCRQFVGLDFTTIFLVAGPTANTPVNVPNSAALAGVRVRCQSATFTPGLNPLGVLASNGLTLVLDQL